MKKKEQEKKELVETKEEQKRKCLENAQEKKDIKKWQRKNENKRRKVKLRRQSPQ